MEHRLLPTKIHIPPARRGTVQRNRLFGLLDNALAWDSRLVLVSAPAGSGKTTLVAGWLRYTGIPAAWVALDPMDNDPIRFWRYLASSLGALGEGIGGSLLSALDGGSVPSQDAMIAALVDDMMDITVRSVIVLDDCHLITSGDVYSGLDRLFNRLPPLVSAVVVTRTDPPLSLGRRRAMAQLSEIRWTDLRFTPGETESMMNGQFGLGLPGSTLDSLQASTEGWVAGLQLAALSVRKSGDVQSLLGSFSGDHRHVADYLVQEVLGQLPEETLSFLMMTSVMERFCAPLCDMVTGRTGSSGILDRLEEANLFLLPLDENRQWYRYHSLFGDLLRKRAAVEIGMEGLEDLYRKACDWFEGQGFLEEAISLAMASPCKDLAADLLERHILTLFFKSETSTVNGWLETLGPEVMKARPLLCAMHANTLAHIAGFAPRALDLTRTRLDEASRSLGCPDSAQGDQGLVRGFIALSHAYLALWKKEGPEIVVNLALQAIASLPPLDEGSVDKAYMRLYSGLYCNLGMSYARSGNPDLALDALDKVLVIGGKCGDRLNVYAAAAHKCSIFRRWANLRGAEEVCRHALAMFRGGTGDSDSDSPFSSSIHVSLAGILLEWNDLPAATDHLNKAMRLSRMASDSLVSLFVELISARLHAAKGDFGIAMEGIGRAKREHPEAFEEMEAWRIRLVLASKVDDPGEKAAMCSWAGRHDFDNLSFNGDTTLVRILISQGEVPGSAADISRAKVFLHKAIDIAEASGEKERLLELLILQALCRRAEGDQHGSLDSLVRSLTIAKQGGYVRIYLDEGVPMQTLLSVLVSRHGRGAVDPGWEPAVDYAGRLLSGFRLTEVESGGFQLLFPRELEVLRMAATGLTNAQLAQKLFISVNTVKKHLTNIYGKLGAANRFDAIEIARHLRLLP